jgi:WXG100 family type VII secretion target
MTIIHMETDACRNIASRVDAIRQNILTELGAINSRTDGMIGVEWISKSAEQFLGEFTNLSGKLKMQADELEEMTRQLREAIAAYEAQDAQFGS